MSEKKADRRTLRTQGLLQEALISLFLEKDYEAVTIKDIVDKANVGRSTFYAHYTGKDDLLRLSIERLREFLVEKQREAMATKGDNGQHLLGFSLPMFEHTRDHLDLYRALVGGRGGTIVLRQFREILSDLVRNELAETATKDSADAMPQELVVQFVVGAFMAVMTWWLDRKARLPPEKIDAVFRQMVLQGILSPAPS